MISWRDTAAMSAPDLISSAQRRHRPEPMPAGSDMDMETDIDLLRIDATEWALLQHACLAQTTGAFAPTQRAELIRLLETGLAEIEACLPGLTLPRRQI